MFVCVNPRGFHLRKAVVEMKFLFSGFSGAVSLSRAVSDARARFLNSKGKRRQDPLVSVKFKCSNGLVSDCRFVLNSVPVPVWIMITRTNSSDCLDIGLFFVVEEIAFIC